MTLQHEHFDAYPLALDFVRWVHSLRPQLFGRARDVRALLDEDCTTIALHIAAGCSRYPSEDHGRFLSSAHEAAMRCAALLDILSSLQALPDDVVLDGRGRVAILAARIEELIRQTDIRDREPVAIEESIPVAVPSNGGRPIRGLT